MGYYFGTRSKKQLETCQEDLQKVLELAIKRSNVDFGLHQGGRTIEEQQKYFNERKSSINPKDYPTPEALAEKAKHIIIAGHKEYGKSRAIDLHCAERYKDKSLAWDDVHLAYISGIITSCAQELYDKKEITNIVRWGGDWDSDGIIALDHTLKDFPHFELIKP